MRNHQRNSRRNGSIIAITMTTAQRMCHVGCVASPQAAPRMMTKGRISVSGEVSFPVPLYMRNRERNDRDRKRGRVRHSPPIWVGQDTPDSERVRITLGTVALSSK